MDQNQDQNDNLFNFDKKPETPAEEPTILSGSGGARAYETPPDAQQPAEPFPAYTPPPPSYTPPSGPAVPPPAAGRGGTEGSRFSS